jgi:hypothetical protein
MATCYGGNLFVNDTANSSVCTPYLLPNASSTKPGATVAISSIPEDVAPLFQCRAVPPAYASFCQPPWRVASAPNNYTDVWTRMDNVTQIRWTTFASAGISEACKESLRNYFCAEYFAPCDGPFSISDPLTEVLQPLCKRLANDCPVGMVRKVCSFSPYTPPNPAECSI